MDCPLDRGREPVAGHLHQRGQPHCVTVVDRMWTALKLEQIGPEL
ncbi:MAG: hypothetical protein ACLVJH_02615 [Faecalibacterium prausnitzii]